MGPVIGDGYVRNFAVCWKSLKGWGLTIVLSLVWNNPYPRPVTGMRIYNIGQSAGNFTLSTSTHFYYKIMSIENIKGSSETLRETTQVQCTTTAETLFYGGGTAHFNFTDYSRVKPQHKKHLDIPFLEWFVGFSEGDGSFITTTNQRALFIINQKSGQILQQIRTKLGFGRVTFCKTYWRYTVADLRSIDRLIALFNGNLLLDKTNIRFCAWLHQRNLYSPDVITHKGKLQLEISRGKQNPYLRTHWCAGFIDAKGYFNAQRIADSRYTENILSHRVGLRFFLDQRGEETILN